MSFLKTKISKIAMAVISISLLFSLASCASTSVNSDEASSDTVAFDTTVDNYNLFFQMIESGSTPEEVLTFLNQWNEAEPENPELAKCYHIFFILVSGHKTEDNSDILTENEPYIEYYDEESETNFLIYKNFIMDYDFLSEGIDILAQAIDLYPERLDLWVMLLKTCQDYFLFDAGYFVADKFLDTVALMEQNNSTWYDHKNVPIIFDNDGHREFYLVNRITDMTYLWISQFPLNTKAVSYSQKILQKLLTIYPNNSKINNELGLVFLSIDSSKAIAYFEKAFELDPEAIEAAFNAVLAASFIGDNQTMEKYGEIILNSGDEKFIDEYKKILESNK